MANKLDTSPWWFICVCVCIRVCISVSADMSPYCSAHDEWLIMKLCMYVGYHTATNVSKFGDDPVTQLNLKKINLSFCIPTYEQCWFNLHMRDGSIHYILYILKLTIAADNIVFRIIKGAY